MAMDLKEQIAQLERQLQEERLKSGDAVMEAHHLKEQLNEQQPRYQAVYVAPTRKLERFRDRPATSAEPTVEEWVEDVRMQLATRKLEPGDPQTGASRPGSIRDGPPVRERSPGNSGARTWDPQRSRCNIRGAVEGVWRWRHIANPSTKVLQLPTRGERRPLGALLEAGRDVRPHLPNRPDLHAMSGGDAKGASG